MKIANNAMHHIITSRRRALAMLLCFLMLFSVCNSTLFAVSDALSESLTATEQSIQTESQEETRAQIKARLMRQIRNEGWDPYSSDMTFSEFYALMELFNEGKLPLQSTSVYSTMAINSQSNEVLGIPRTKFMLSGLPENPTGSDAPLPYDNVYGVTDGDEEDEAQYPAGLDKYEVGYKRPPKSWSGLGVNEESRAKILTEKESTDPNVAGKVDQALFAGIKYDGYYVRRVTVDGIDAAILGVIKMKENNQDKYVYYYLSPSALDTDISSTTLPDGQKFIIQYVPNEHKIEYEVYSEEIKDENNITDNVVTNVDESSVTWVDSLFGASRPEKTTEGAYAFDVVAPYNYTTTLYLKYTMTVSDSDQAVDAVSFDVTIELTGTKAKAKAALEKAYKDAYNASSIPEYVQAAIDSKVDEFTEYNDGYPLGTEPTYSNVDGMSIVADTSNSPSVQTMNATFYNNAVIEDRTIIAVVKEIENYVPKFDAYTAIAKLSGTGNRGSCAKAFTDKITVQDRETGKSISVPYDYEDEFLYLMEKNNLMHGDREYPQSKYIYTDIGNTNGNAIGNVRNDGDWNWGNRDSTNHEMVQDEDGTYYWTWTFQTNTKDGGYTMDVLAFNGVSLKVPFYPKYIYPYSATDKEGTEVGSTSYFTEATLANGAKVKAEYLVRFGTSEYQRVYRVTITGAKSNVSLTGMNLMQGTGADEVSVYDLQGVYSTGAQSDTSIQVYHNNAWRRESIASIIIKDDFNFSADSRGANIRFRAIDGYGSPYYLFESAQNGIVINNGIEQSSIQKYDDGTLNYSTQRPVINLSDYYKDENGEVVDKQITSGYVYYDDTEYDDPDDEGWYYVRLDGAGGNKITLLTIVARPAKYVVRYMPETDEVAKPKNMPQFTHDANCHPSFRDPNNNIPDEQYDDNNGFYYDTLSNSTAKLPTNKNGIIIPSDPDNQYNFVDWVLVDGNGFPVLLDENGERVLLDKDGNPVDENGNSRERQESWREIHFQNQAIDITHVYEYAIANDGLGGEEIDVYVLRLKPTWKKVEKPYYYDVVLNWVDAQGKLYNDSFSDWATILAEEPNNQMLYVYINKDATPLHNWIAGHPTYTFWDDINNAVDDDESVIGGKTAEQKIQDAFDAYLMGQDTLDSREDILAALNRLDYNDNDQPDFERLGSDHFVVHENHGTVSIWMYENKGGLVFRKDVQEESFTANEKFYFTVEDVLWGSNESAMIDDAVYDAYPEYVYDSKGNKTQPLAADVLHVTFKNGKINDIVDKDGNSRYEKITITENGESIDYICFVLEDNDGIGLYVPAGKYTIVELANPKKSSTAPSYRVEIEHHIKELVDGKETEKIDPEWPSEWDEPTNVGKYLGKGGVTKVSAPVKFETGEAKIAQVVVFCNQTTALSIEKKVENVPDKEKSKYVDTEFSFNVKLQLPDGYVLPTDDQNNKYATVNIYNTSGNTLVRASKITLTQTEDEWTGSFKLKDKQRAAIVMEVPATKESIAYWVEEVNQPRVFTPVWTNDIGVVNPGERAIITCVNHYGEIKCGYLAITANGKEVNANENFIFRITDESGEIDITVSVKGGGVTYVYLPLGEYKVKEVSDWSWRYNTGKCAQALATDAVGTATVQVAVGNRAKDSAVHADFTYERNKGWVGGEGSGSYQLV